MPSTETVLPDLADLDRPALERCSRRPACLASARARCSAGSTRGETDFARMTDLGRDAARRLAEAVPHQRRRPRTRDRSADGTQKFLLRLADGRRIEVGVHPRHAEADVLHLEPGRLRDGLRLLPDREDGVRPQPHAGGDRRAGPRPRRRDSAFATRPSTSSSWAWASRCTTTTR